MSETNRPEPWLCSLSATEAVIRKYGFRFKKKFGQNFLIDTHVIDKIIRSAEIGQDDFVIEIGPGIGTLTQFLAYHAARVTAVEIDKNLIPVLEEDTLKGYDNITLINEDVLQLDLKRLIEEENDGKPVKIVANLPYYITTPILMGIFEKHIPFESVTVMVQKEVAERMEAGPGSRDYGALSLAVQYYAVPEIMAYVPPNCFIPHPGVGSSVICLKSRSEDNRIRVKDEELMFRIIKASFAQRRKTLLNGLRNSEDLKLSKEEAEEAIRRAGLPEGIRGEALSLAQFAALSDAVGAVAGTF